MEKILKKLGPLADFEFNKLFAGQVFSHFSDAIIQFILIAWVISFLPSAGVAMALIFFCFLLPQFILSPFAGIFVDKFPRKVILVISCFYRALLVLLFAIGVKSGILSSQSPLYLIYTFTFLVGIGAAFFYPAKMAALTNIVKSAQLKFANAINGPIGPLALLLGALIANFYFAKLGLIKGLFLISGGYFAATIVLALLHFKIIQKITDKNEGFIADFTQSISYLKTHKKAFYLVVIAICVAFIGAVFSNTLNALITDYYGMEFSDLTKLRSMLGVGIIAGMGITLYFARFVRVPHLFAFGFITLCIALFTSPMCATINMAWFWLVPIGIADAVLLVTIDTILQKSVPDRIRGKVFGFQLTLTTLSFLIGTSIVAAVSSVVNPLLILKLIAGFALILALMILIVDKSFRYFLLKATFGQIFLALFRYKFEGIENLPKKGRIILAGNHTGHLDPFIIQMATHRQLWFVTGPAAFKMPIIKNFLRYFNVLPLQFGKGIEALDTGIKKLQAGEAVVIFPEGKFTPDGSLSKFNRGVGILAKQANCPIIPFAIQGGYETWGGNRRLPRLFNEITIQFGQPVLPEQDEKEISKELQQRVDFMKKALYRRAFYGINQKLHDNFLDLMQEKGDLFGQAKALSIKLKDGYESYNYIELSRLAKNFANYLIEDIKVERDERIAILTESRPEFGIGIFASIQTGAITVPLDCKLTIPEWTSILSDCNPRILCCSSHYLNAAVELKNNVQSIEHIFILDNEKPENCEYQTVFEVKGDIEKDLGKPRSLDETALIVYTSGTTGNPKGVMISFGNIYSQLRDFESIMKINAHNTLVSILPLNHLLELNVGFFGMLYMGAKVCYIKSLSPKEIAKVMKEQQATNMLVVPLFAKMLKSSIEKEIKKQPQATQKIFWAMYQLASVMPLHVKRLMFKSVLDGFGGKMECFVSGGAPLENEVAVFFNRIGIPIYQGYGLTETSPTISTNYLKSDRLGTVGRPLPSVKVKIAENGEILATGPNVMQGYYGKPEMTAEVIDEDGWFHTGDIGEMDKQGYIKITGRIKNMIVLGGGKKIFPEEVEAILEHSDKIKELCVMALKIKTGNKAGTEEVGVVIVPSDELTQKPDIDIQKELEVEVKKLAEESLAAYKQPTVVVVYKEDLPKTSTRKVKRQELLTWYEGLN